MPKTGAAPSVTAHSSTPAGDTLRTNTSPKLLVGVNVTGVGWVANVSVPNKVPAMSTLPTGSIASTALSDVSWLPTMMGHDGTMLPVASNLPSHPPSPNWLAADTTMPP